MDIKISIGREVEGANTIRVPSTYYRVSRNHATFYWHDGKATIEDNGSTNGTFVNGCQITQTQLKKDDIIWLGGFGSDCYRLDLEQLFASCRKREDSQYVNYTEQTVEASNDTLETHVFNEQKELQTQQLNDDKPNNYLGLAVVTVLFNLIFGIAAIICSIRVNKLWNKGNKAGAKKASKNARNCSITGLILGVIGIIRILISL